ncbi:MAG: hypothetical protein ACR2OG_01755 [Gemmatimonadaceae bacterium]
MTRVRRPILTALLVLGACRFDRVVVPTGQGPLVVHVVINRGEFYQYILVERALTGRVDTDSTTFDPDNPIVSSGGTPVSDARVELFWIPNNPNQLRCRPAIGVEQRTVRADGRGAGVYAVPGFPSFSFPKPSTDCDGISVVPGETIQLVVTDPTGLRVSASTRIPLAQIVAARQTFDTLDRTRDTLKVEWTTTTEAPHYLFQVGSSFGPFSLFVTDRRVILPGDLRNPFARGQPALFLPGFQQTVTVGAVDQNYWDYYRTRFLPGYAGPPISHVQGGAGLVGSIVPLERRTVEVVKRFDAPIEGRYLASTRVFDPYYPGFVESLTLYAYADSAGATLLSGSFQSDTLRTGVLGVMRGSRVTFALVRQQSARDTLRSFAGELDGRSLRGTLSGGGAGAIEFRKQ